MDQPYRYATNALGDHCGPDEYVAVVTCKNCGRNIVLYVQFGTSRAAVKEHPYFGCPYCRTYYNQRKGQNNMSTASALLILKLVAEGVGVAREIADLARRVQAGEEITNAELDLARAQVGASVEKWDAAAKDAGDQPQP